MTDFSSKDLLPQLTDVLEALADSHGRLLLKIQGLRAEHVGAATGGLPARGPEARRGPAPSEGTHSEAPDSLRHTRTDIEGDPGMQTPPFAARQTEQQTLTPIEALAAGGDQRESGRGQSPTTTVGPIPTRHADEVEAESVDRNYNFFDELDDRLARLDQDPPSTPVED